MSPDDKAQDPRSLPARWSRAVIYGLGASGRAAAELLLERGVQLRGYDDSKVEGDEIGALASRAGFELWTRDADPMELLEDADALVLSPGVATGRALVSLAQERGLEVLGELELAWRVLESESPGVVIAITGSNGKSTTTALAGALLSAAGIQAEVCGNIGEPFSSRVSGVPGRTFVVEVSSFQLETVSRFRPRVASLLNLAADHLDRHRDLETYARIKARIFARQGEGDVAVLNGDDPLAVRAATPIGVRRRLFSRLGPVVDGCFLDRRRVLEVSPSAGPRELFSLDDLPLEGVHNLENAMAAALMAASVGVDAGAFPAALAGFRGLPHRLERVRELGGVTWFDDSKGTNVAATGRSLEGFRDRSVHLILGGRSKNADLGALKEIVERKVRALYLIGESAADFEALLSPVVPCEMAETIERAVALAAEAVSPGEAVLLSPACASFDQFRNFVERGEVFQQLVHRLQPPTDASPRGQGRG